MEIKIASEIERGIQTKFKQSLLSPFIRAISDYDLIAEGDMVAVAISGGKDSLLMAKLFQIFARYSKVRFTPVFLSMDPGFNEINKKTLVENCQQLEIDVHFYDSDIFEVTEKISKDYPCYMCAKMRRGFLYRKTKELGCNKLALGHHFDDVIETTMLNILYAGSFKTMVPKIHSENFEGIELIRPLYYVKEESIKKFTRWSGIHVMDCGCKVAAGKVSSKRKEIKELIANIKKIHNDVDKCIFKAAENINLEAVLGYEKNNIKYDFAKIYKENESYKR